MAIVRQKSSSKTRAFSSTHTHTHALANTHTHNKKDSKMRAQRLSMAEASWHDWRLNRQGVVSTASIMGEMEAGSLRLNKSKGKNIPRGLVGSYLATLRAQQWQLWTQTQVAQHLDHNQSLTQFSWANSSRERALVLSYFRSHPHPLCLNLTSTETTRYFSFYAFFFFCFCSCLEAFPFFSALWRWNKLVSWHGYFWLEIYFGHLPMETVSKHNLA